MLSLTSPIKTPYHRLPATAKLALLCAFTFALFQTSDLTILAGALAFVVILYTLPGARFFRIGIDRLLPIWPFLAIILIWHLVTVEYAAGVGVGVRLVAAVSLANLVTMTTRLDDLADVAIQLTKPLNRFGMSGRSIGIAMALVVRFTPVLAGKVMCLLESWKSRSAAKPNWRLIIPFSSLALDDADHVAEAIKARGGI